MSDLASQSLALACVEALFERDSASRAMGIRLIDVAPGQASVEMLVRPDMVQGHGTCHGGYLFALADSAFAFACNTYDKATVAIGCSIDFVAPAAAGDSLIAHAAEQSRSGRTGNYDVRITQHDGQLVALFRGKSYTVRGSVLAQENNDE